MPDVVCAAALMIAFPEQQESAYTTLGEGFGG